MILTYEQHRWLTTRGGRTEEHVKIGEEGLYVEMYHPTMPNNIEHVTLPPTTRSIEDRMKEEIQKKNPSA